MFRIEGCQVACTLSLIRYHAFHSLAGVSSSLPVDLPCMFGDAGHS